MTGARRAGVEQVSGIYVLADDDPRWRHSVRAQVKSALAGGARCIQLRLKHTPDGVGLQLARWMVAECRTAGALSIVNDRFDLALLAGADGVHLGQDDLAPEALPADARERLWVGLSTHTREQLEASRSRPIDYVAMGPVFGTHSKASEYDERGLELLAWAAGRAAHPLVAIGGIDADNVRSVAASGAAAAAVISAVAAADDPATATRALAAAFESGR